MGTLSLREMFRRQTNGLTVNIHATGLESAMLGMRVDEALSIDQQLTSSELSSLNVNSDYPMLT
jgi:hypothetical protein